MSRTGWVRLAMALVMVGVLLGTSPTVAAELSSEELSEGWISLFDGQTLFGWKAANKADWHVVDGEIRVDSGDPGLLCTTTQFADYVLQLDFLAGADTNSGVFLRTSPRPKNPQGDCYELNIAPADNPFPTGSFVGRQKIELAVEVTDGQWHTFEVTAQGNHLTVSLDGKVVNDYIDPKPLGRGFVGLQFNSGGVAFRNIRLKPLGLKPIFNGRDLSGWKTDRAEQSEFSVTEEGALRVQNGKGQIESEGTFGDFVLQLQCLVSGDGLNSGIFFRSIPGDFWMGYESQIHNGIIDGDPTKPVDCGTGGIFRRQNARSVRARDFKWFHKTIVAEGPHLTVWVNGFQVSDWTDRRKPHTNPRKGLRLEPGTIIIQGHDPTTDLSFRELRIAEMPGRR